MSLLTPDQTVFESKFCSRCGGGGSYSFNLMHGSKCYGCSGQGVQLTKRGAAAKAFWIASQEKPLSEVKPGMYFWDDTHGFKPKWLPVLEVRATASYAISNGANRPYIAIDTRRGSHFVFADSIVRCIKDEEERQASLAAALAYQATLGKNGKPMKKKGTTA